MPPENEILTKPVRVRKTYLPGERSGTTKPKEVRQADRAHDKAILAKYPDCPALLGIF